MARKKAEPDKIVEVPKLFWCYKSQQWLYTIACLARRKTQTEGCVRCRQGSGIEKQSVELATPKETPKIVVKKSKKPSFMR